MTRKESISLLTLLEAENIWEGSAQSKTRAKSRNNGSSTIDSSGSLLPSPHSEKASKPSAGSSVIEGNSTAVGDAASKRASNLLKGGLKSLTTLRRVVQILRSNSGSDISSVPALSSEKNTVNNNNNSSNVRIENHVPYRESLLTRLLQSSLAGNCLMFMISFVSARKDTLANPAHLEALSRSLRFAAEISELHNQIWVDNQTTAALQKLFRAQLQAQQEREIRLRAQQQASLLSESAAVGEQQSDKQQISVLDDYSGRDGSITAEQGKEQEKERENAFSHLLNSMQDEMSVLARQLDVLERRRFESMSRLGIEILQLDSPQHRHEMENKRSKISSSNSSSSSSDSSSSNSSSSGGGGGARTSGGEGREENTNKRRGRLGSIGSGGESVERVGEEEPHNRIDKALEETENIQGVRGEEKREEEWQRGQVERGSLANESSECQFLDSAHGSSPSFSMENSSTPAAMSESSDAGTSAASISTRTPSGGSGDVMRGDSRAGGRSVQGKLPPMKPPLIDRTPSSSLSAVKKSNSTAHHSSSHLLSTGVSPRSSASSSSSVPSTPLTGASRSPSAGRGSTAGTTTASAGANDAPGGRTGDGDGSSTQRSLQQVRGRQGRGQAKSRQEGKEKERERESLRHSTGSALSSSAAPSLSSKTQLVTSSTSGKMNNKSRIDIRNSRNGGRTGTLAGVGAMAGSVADIGATVAGKNSSSIRPAGASSGSTKDILIGVAAVDASNRRTRTPQSADSSRPHMPMDGVGGADGLHSRSTDARGGSSDNCDECLSPTAQLCFLLSPSPGPGSPRRESAKIESSAFPAAPGMVILTRQNDQENKNENKIKSANPQDTPQPTASPHEWGAAGYAAMPAISPRPSTGGEDPASYSPHRPAAGPPSPPCTSSSKEEHHTGSLKQKGIGSHSVGLFPQLGYSTRTAASKSERIMVARENNEHGDLPPALQERHQYADHPKKQQEQQQLQQQKEKVDRDEPVDLTALSRRRFRRLGRREDDAAGNGNGDADTDDVDEHLSPLERKFLRHVTTGQVAECMQCVRQGVNIHVKNSFERDAVQISARNGHVHMLTLLVREGCSLSSRGPKGDTLVHLAAYNGHVPALRWLQQAGAVMEAVDMHGSTALHIAARRGECAVLEYLLDEVGVDALQEDFDGRTALECVPRRGANCPEEDLQRCRSYLLAVMADMADDSGAAATIAAAGGAAGVEEHEN